MLSRSMCTGVQKRPANSGLSMMAVQPRVGPLWSSIFSFGHSTTVTKGTYILFAKSRRQASRNGRAWASNSGWFFLDKPSLVSVFGAVVGHARYLEVGV